LKAARHFALREPHLQGLPKTGGALQPVGANGSKALAAVPLFQTLLHRHRERDEQHFGHNHDAGGGEVDCGISSVWRVRGTIDADPDRDGKRRRAFAFDQNAGHLRGSDEQIVWPFQLQQRTDLRRAGRDAVMQCERGYK